LGQGQALFMGAICLHDILKDIASNDSDSMTRVATAARTEPGVDEWKPTQAGHETPSLLSFTRREESVEETHGDISELLTRKFREFFP